MSVIDLNEGIPLPSIAEIKVLPKLTLQVRWSEGSREGRIDDVDLSPAINSYKIYRPLRNNPSLFGTAKLIEDGDVVAWDGDDLEMTAEMIEELAEQTMTPSDFAAFLQDHELTQSQAAALLGRSRRQIGYYLSTGPIPRVVALACIGYAVQHQRAARRDTNPQQTFRRETSFFNLPSRPWLITEIVKKNMQELVKLNISPIRVAPLDSDNRLYDFDFTLNVQKKKWPQLVGLEQNEWPEIMRGRQMPEAPYRSLLRASQNDNLD
jgi:hypothetical protein